MTEGFYQSVLWLNIKARKCLLQWKKRHTWAAAQRTNCWVLELLRCLNAHQVRSAMQFRSLVRKDWDSGTWVRYTWIDISVILTQQLLRTLWACRGISFCPSNSRHFHCAGTFSHRNLFPTRQQALPIQELLPHPLLAARLTTWYKAKHNLAKPDVGGREYTPEMF